MNMSPEEMARIWERVAPPPPPPPPPPDEKGGAERFLRDLIEKAAELAKLYETMAKRLRSKPEAEGLRAMARDEERAERLLNKELFILTGDTYYPRVTPLRQNGLAGDIRAALMAEERMEAALNEAAGREKSPKRRAVYRELSQIARRHGAKLDAMLDRMMR